MTDVDSGYEKIWCTATPDYTNFRGIIKLNLTGNMKVVNQFTSEIIYDPSYVTSGSNFFLILQNDGDLVVYNDENKV